MNMRATIFFLVGIALTANIRGESEDEGIDVYKEIRALKAGLNQKNEEIRQLKHQLDSFTNRNSNKRFVVEMDTEAEIVALKTRLDQKDKEIEELKKQQDSFTNGNRNKRFVMEMDIEAEIIALKKQQGSTYTRWGRTTCPNNGTDLVYSGYMAGTYQVGTDKGTGANYLCLSGQPTWDHYSETINNEIIISAVEYQFTQHNTGHHHDLADFFGSDLTDAEAPCAVCRSHRNTNVMIPGRTDCYPGWTKEYSGYLVGAYPGYDDASEYVCLDRRPEVVANSGSDDNDNKLYFVEARCGSSLECPPYINNRELACVVCSL